MNLSLSKWKVLMAKLLMKLPTEVVLFLNLTSHPTFEAISRTLFAKANREINK